MAGRYLNKKSKKSRKGLKITLIVLGIILGLLIIGQMVRHHKGTFKQIVKRAFFYSKLLRFFIRQKRNTGRH